jgi:hypothetical protein
VRGEYDVFLFIFIFFIVIFILYLVGGAEKKERMIGTMEQFAQKEDFRISQQIMDSSLSRIIAIDHNLKKICFIDSNQNNPLRLVKNFDDIMECEIQADNVSITKSSAGGTLGGTIVGGVLAGGVGAFIGGLSA